MSDEERGLALELLVATWLRVADNGGQVPIVATLRSAAAELPRAHPHVSTEYASHVGDAAVWYLDRAVRRVADPDRDGTTAGRRALNLGWFASVASAGEIERLFAMAAALNVQDE